MTHVLGGHVQGAELAVELVGVVDHGGEVAEGDELAVVEQAADETGVVVAPLLAVGDHVDTGAQLGIESEADGVVGGLVEDAVVEAAFEVVVHGLEHPAGAGPAPDPHDGEGLDGGSGGGLGEQVRDGDFDQGPGRGRGGWRRGGRLTRGEGTLRHEVAALAARLRPGDELVAGHPTPGGQLDFDRRLGGLDFEQAAGGEGVDVAADEQQEPAAAVEVAAVEAGVGREGVALDGINSVGGTAHGTGSAASR